jgi:hypothetical protein
VIPGISCVFKSLEVQQIGTVTNGKTNLSVPALFTSTSIVPHVSTA